MDSAPASSPARPVNKIVRTSAPVAPIPSTRARLLTRPSFAPKTAARNVPDSCSRPRAASLAAPRRESARRPPSGRSRPRLPRTASGPRRVASGRARRPRRSARRGRRAAGCAGCCGAADRRRRRVVPTSATRAAFPRRPAPAGCLVPRPSGAPPAGGSQRPQALVGEVLPPASDLTGRTAQGSAHIHIMATGVALLSARFSDSELVPKLTPEAMVERRGGR